MQYKEHRLVTSQHHGCCTLHIKDTDFPIGKAGGLIFTGEMSFTSRGSSKTFRRTYFQFHKLQLSYKKFFKGRKQMCNIYTLSEILRY